MNTAAPTTIPTLSSLLEELNLYSINNTGDGLRNTLRILHSTLEVLQSYAWYQIETSDATPADRYILDVLESTTTMAIDAIDYSNRMEFKLTTTSKNFRDIAKQLGFEVQP